MRAIYNGIQENIRRHKPRSRFHFIIVFIVSLFPISYPGHIIPNLPHLLKLNIFLFPRGSGPFMHESMYLG